VGRRWIWMRRRPGSRRSARRGSTKPGLGSSPARRSGRGTFTSVRALVAQITDYINSWNANPRPFTWIATADEILAKVKVVEANVRKLVDNNA
jgi:hypothetical protein